VGADSLKKYIKVVGCYGIQGFNPQITQIFADFESGFREIDGHWNGLGK
jgi:hypothetical protein